MKLLQLGMACVLGAVIGLALGRQQPVSKPTGLSERIVEASPNPAAHPDAKIVAERNHWKREADKFRDWAEEVHRLRGEVTRLNSELASVNRTPPAGKNQPSQKGAPAASPKAAASGSRKVELAEVPVAVQEVLHREAGTAGGLYTYLEKDRPIFGFKGKTEDGRFLALKLDQDGTILERHAQISREELPAEIAAAIERSFGELAIHQATQVTSGNTQYYELLSKGADQGMEIRIREDGVLLSYAAKIRPPEELIKK